jgi:CRP-like cAMP-binding protein
VQDIVPKGAKASGSGGAKDAHREGAHPTMVECAACPLRKLPVFTASGPEEIAVIRARKVGEMVVAARGSILREGDTPERLYTLLAGWAFRFKTLPDGRRQILNFLLPGDLVGLQAKIFEEASHGVDALTDVRLCLFSRDRIWDIFRHQPQIAFDVTWLSAREEGLVDESLLSAGRRTAAESVAALVLQLHRRATALGLATQAGVPMPLTQAHIADALGLSSVHANRTLRLMRQRKLFTLAGGMLRDVDLAGLRRLARASEGDGPVRPLI